MKVNVVKDPDGKVVATFETAVGDGPSVRPVLRSGHTVQEVEASENYTAEIDAFYAQHSR